MKLYLISNGDISYFESEKLAGRTDISLEADAKKELKVICQSGYYRNVDMVFTAPLKRCIETASLVYPAHAINFEDDLNEYNYGEFEGQPYDFLKNNDKYLSWLSTCGEHSHGGNAKQTENSTKAGKLGGNLCEPIDNFNSRLRRGIVNSCKTLASNKCEVGAIVTTPNVIMNLIPEMIESTASCLISGFDADSSEVGMDKYQFKLKPGHGFEVVFDIRSESFKSVVPMANIH